MEQTLSFEARLTIDGTAYDVLRLTCEEALDSVPSVTCELTDRSGGPAPSALIGKPLSLAFARGDTQEERQFVGIVVSASRRTASGDEETATHVIARPRLFRLSQRQDLRVFQDMAVPDIVKQVLSAAGIPEADQDWHLDGSYPKRIYTTQHRETDLEFVRRLLSEEGIAFVVDGSSGTDRVRFFDADLGAIEGETRLVHRPADGLSPAHDAVSIERHRAGTAPGRVHLRDHDFEKPRVKLDSKAEAGSAAEKPLEVFVYPGRFRESADGDRYARVLLQSLRARRETVTGVANVPRLLPGHRFSLDEHPYSALNREYLVLATTLHFEGIRHQGRAAEAGNRSRISFEAAPVGEDAYRPPRAARAQASPGVQAAFITGPSGKEIHPDEHARVKVRFPWDRSGKTDDTSSLWVRTCQLPLGGSMLTPRVGWESQVAFSEGDVDRPYVFGRMYNAKTPPPYSLPENKTRMSIQTATTPGGGSVNEIRMEDKAGDEEMFMNASRDCSVSAGNNATESVGNNESRSIGSNQTLAVTDSMQANVGADQKVSIAADQFVNVETFLVEQVGSHSLAIGGNRDIKAGGDHNRTISGASTLDIGGMEVDLVAGSVDVMALATMDDSVGAALVEMTASNRTLAVQGDHTENAGAAKIVLASGGRAVEVGGTLNHKVAGAVITSISGTRADASKGAYTEVAGGAQIIKANVVMFEAEDLLSVVMGGSTLTLTPASVSIAGTSITLDGEVVEEAAMVVDN
ncbi:MAG: type VI secretion system tip protein TssI/VgrG [Polyangiaceae bacterium]